MDSSKTNTCTPCRQRKVKCSGRGPPGQNGCNKCLQLGLRCAFDPVKRGRPIGRQTERLLRHPAHLPDDVTANSLLSMAAASSSQFPGSEGSSYPGGSLDSPLSVIFGDNGENNPAKRQGRNVRTQPRPFSVKPDTQSDLDPVKLGYLTDAECRALYTTFIERMNGYTGLLDKALHTYEYVRSTSFFLLSVTIQAAAGRDLNPVSQARSAYIARTILQHIKDTIWPMVLLRNMRSVQICQACMIWTTFTDSKDITDEEPSWFLFGHALRIAVELGLSRELKHSESHDSHSKAVLRDAQRCWMTCWIADRSWSAQSARPALIPENETTLDAQNWLIQTQANADDASIVALIQLRRILERLPDNAQLADRKVRSNTDLIQRDLEVWKRTWSAGTYHTCSRLGQMTFVYHLYANCLLHARRSALSVLGAENDLFESAAAMITHVAESVNGEVLQYAHNSFYTMLLYCLHCCYKLHLKLENRTLADSKRLSDDTHQIAIRLQQSSPSHGLVHTGATWCLVRINTLLAVWKSRSKQGGVRTEPQPAIEVSQDDTISALDTSWLDLLQAHSGTGSSGIASQEAAFSDTERQWLLDDPLALFMNDDLSNPFYTGIGEGLLSLWPQ